MSTRWVVGCWLGACLVGSGVGHGQVLLSEFQAANIRTINDEDGNAEDWIELHNAGDAAVDLAGWWLTDDSDRLTKWQFPSTNLGPGEFLLVFASGKDRRVPGRPLHTSFRLGTTGEYLALVEPDGRSLATHYAPAYPPQAIDISYGLPLVPMTVPLLAAGSPGWFLVPGDGDLGTNWVRPDFDDSAWLAVTGGVGFNVPPDLYDTDVESLLRGRNSGAYLRLPFAVTNLSGLDQLKLRVRYNDGFVAFLNGVPVAQRQAPVAAPGGVYANSASDWSLTGQQGFNNWYYGSYDRAADADGVYQADRDFVSSGASWAWNGGAWVLGPGNPPWDAITQGGWTPNGENSGGVHWVIRRWVCEAPGSFTCRLAVAKENPTCGNGATVRVFVNGAEWYQATVAFNDSSGVRTELGLADLNAGDLVDFALDPLGTDGGSGDSCDSLTFSAVIEQLPAAGPVWNSTATAARSPEQTPVAEEFNLTLYRDLLVSGTNLLALQGLNLAAEDPDFLLSAELAGDYLGLDPSRPAYFSKPTPGKENGPGTTALGPIIGEVEHVPSQPADGDDLVVRARVTRSLRPVGPVALRYRVMYGGEASAAMLDDGAHDDGAAGDGIYGARIAAGASRPGQMIRYAVAAVDDAGVASRFPTYSDPLRSPQYEGTVVRDPALELTALPVLHWFIQNPGAADSDARAGCSLFFDGEFYDNVGATVHGQSTRGFPKRSYDLDFNPGYKFRWSDDAPRVDDVNLLTTWADKAYLRNVLGHETYRDSGAHSHFALAVRVQQNGAFYSVANLVENGDDNFLKRLGLDPRGALYKMYNSAESASGNEKKTRKNEGTADLAALIQGMSQSSATARQTYLYDNLNVPQMIDFLAAKIITADTDCCHKNYYLYRDSDGTREWMAMPWDVDLCFGRVWTCGSPCYAYYDQQIYTNQSIFIGSGNVVFSPLYGTAATRQMFLRRLRTLMDTLFQPPDTPATNDFYRLKTLALRDRIAPDAALDLAKWGTWGNRETITQAVSRIWNEFLPGRRLYLFRTLSVTGGGEIPLPQPTNAVVEIGGLEFRPAGGNPLEEWLALTNANTYAVDISGWRLDGAVRFTFNPGTVIPSKSGALVSPDVRVFRARATSPKGGERRLVLGPYEGNLSAWGETVSLLDDRGRLVHTRTYTGSPSPAQQYLRITEIMYHPSPMPGQPGLPPSAFEFIELRNVGPVPLDLRGVRFAEGIAFDFSAAAITNLAPGARVLVVRDALAFALRYGADRPVAGQFAGALDGGGERLRLEDGFGEKILDFCYSSAWHPITDGHGFSLAIADDTLDWRLWEAASSWRANGQAEGTPGLPDPPLPSLPPVVINEVLAHTDPPEQDAIELHNPTDTDADISGWYLTDDFALPQKFRLPVPTVLPAGGFASFAEAQFNPVPGQFPSFALNSQGDDVWLFSADAAGQLTGYVQGFEFGATANGVSLGRYGNSAGEVDHPPLTAVTLGESNAPPRVGPVVLSEIMFHPDPGSDPALPAAYIEIANLTTTNVPLFDPAAATNTWRLRRGVEFDFPADVTLPPGGRALVVGFDAATNTAAAAAFRARYNVPAAVVLYGPWRGQLANDDDVMDLELPGASGPGARSYVRVDHVHYLDRAPWPEGADGTGASLQRRALAGYGNEPTNWFAATPTAGAPNQPNLLPTVQLDAPQEGAVYLAPTNVLLLATAQDSDGRIARLEFRAGERVVAELTAPPFASVWTNPPVGRHSLAAVAIDDRLGTVASSPVTITVVAPPPAVRLTAPLDGAMQLAGSTVALAAEAESEAARIDRVRFYDGPTLLSELLAPPYAFAWAAVPAGAHSLRAVAVDTLGSVSTSAVVRVGLAAGTTEATTLVPSGSRWSYLDDGSAPEAAWTGPGFDEAGWSSGPAELGYGDRDEGRPEATQIGYGPNASSKFITSYFRQGFAVTNAAAIQDLTIGLLRDDGAVVYLNGSEVWRSNLPEGAIDAGTLALAAVAGVEETAYVTAPAPPAQLREGANVLAVEVHQSSPGSSDLSFDLALTGTRVWLAPVILTQPESRSAHRGADVALSGWAGGTPPLACQWRFNQAPLNGATNATLILTNVQPAQAGTYQLVVTNTLGAALSETVTVTLTNRPPVALADGILVPQGQTAFLSPSILTANDSDPDGDQVLFQGVAAASERGASVALVSGLVRYSPPPVFQGSDRFGYTVADAQGASSAGEVAVFVYAGVLPSPGQVVIIPEGRTVRLRYAAGSGVTCEWQRSRDLLRWELIGSDLAPPHGLVELVEELVSTGSAYYRVVRK